MPVHVFESPWRLYIHFHASFNGMGSALNVFQMLDVHHEAAACTPVHA